MSFVPNYSFEYPASSGNANAPYLINNDGGNNCIYPKPAVYKRSDNVDLENGYSLNNASMHDTVITVRSSSSAMSPPVLTSSAMSPSVLMFEKKIKNDDNDDLFRLTRYIAFIVTIMLVIVTAILGMTIYFVIVV
jgi:hypothetical protein